MDMTNADATVAAIGAPADGGEQRNNLTVAQLLLEYLKLEQATTIFGIPGGAAVWIIDELKKQNTTFDFVVCRQETGAAYMAHGFAWAGGGLGVVLTTSGPAAANALSGTVNANAAGCPLDPTIRSTGRDPLALEVGSPIDWRELEQPVVGARACRSPYLSRTRLPRSSFVESGRGTECSMRDRSSRWQRDCERSWTGRLRYLGSVSRTWGADDRSAQAHD